MPTVLHTIRGEVIYPQKRAWRDVPFAVVFLVFFGACAAEARWVWRVTLSFDKRLL